MELTGNDYQYTRDQTIADFRGVLGIARQFIAQHLIFDHRSLDENG
jgi:hypothetical protein